MNAARTSRSLALRLRGGLLIAAIFCWVAAAAVLVVGPLSDWNVRAFAPLPPVFLELVEGLKDRIGGERTAAVWGGLVLGWLFFSQWLFLRPRQGWALHLAEHGRPMRTAVLAAAFAAMLVTGGLLFTLLELAGWLEMLETLWLVELLLCAIWAAWALVFWRRWRRGDRYDQLDRMTRRLLAGSLLELLLAIPADAWAARRNDCYCARGTYWGIVLGCAALLWSFGPGVLLLFWHEKVERERRHASQAGPRH